MKAGVSKLPWRVVTRPRRAALSCRISSYFSGRSLIATADRTAGSRAQPLGQFLGAAVLEFNEIRLAAQRGLGRDLVNEVVKRLHRIARLLELAPQVIPRRFAGVFGTVADEDKVGGFDARQCCINP